MPAGESREAKPAPAASTGLASPRVDRLAAMASAAHATLAVMRLTVRIRVASQHEKRVRRDNTLSTVPTDPSSPGRPGRSTPRPPT